MSEKVDFFITGAPKCGTTALSEYLRRHPGVCFAIPKEPVYFLGRSRFNNVEEYHSRCFSHCQKGQIRGEGSVWYLYSREALEAIKEYNPDAKIIVMFRNPVDMVYSWHSQLLYDCKEDKEDFRTAWYLQGKRRKGQDIPSSCNLPEQLIYEDVGKFSARLEVLWDVFGKDKVKVVIFDDFVSDTEKVYKDVLGYLGVSQDFVPDFKRFNPNKVYKSRFLARIFHRPPKWVDELMEKVRRLLGVRSLGLRKLEFNLNTSFKKRKKMDSEMRKELREVFREDVMKLSEMVGKDLSGWVNAKE